MINSLTSVHFIHSIHMTIKLKPSLIKTMIFLKSHQILALSIIPSLLDTLATEFRSEVIFLNFTS